MGPVGPAGEGMVALDAALAGLGIGRKFCRQLRAELRLEDVTRQGSYISGGTCDSTYVYTWVVLEVRFMIGTVCILFVSVENAYAYICFVLKLDRQRDR